MQPLVRAAVFAAAIAAIGMFGLTTPKKPPETTAPEASPAAPPLAASCGPYQLPEGDACIPLPRPGRTPLSEGPDPPPRTALRERGELIPRRPDRPADAAAYRFPLAADAQPIILGGLDLPPGAVPDAELGPSAVLLGASAGDEVIALSLEGQEGPTEIGFVGDIVGTTVVTVHMVRDGGRLRQILLLHGLLEHASDQAIVGSSVETGEVIGYVGQLKSGRDALYIEARQVREGTSWNAVDPSKLRDEATSIPCDVRNVLRHGASL